MAKQEKESSEQTKSKQTSWFDKVNYSRMWMDLIYKATRDRIDGRTANYMVAVDAITRTLLKEDREHIKKLKSELMGELGYGFDEKLAVYDELLEYIVDRLEDAGYLTKELIIETFTDEISTSLDDARD